MHVPHSVGVAREDTEEGYTCRRRGRGSSEKQMDVCPGAGKRWGRGRAGGEEQPCTRPGAVDSMDGHEVVQMSVNIYTTNNLP